MDAAMPSSVEPPGVWVIEVGCCGDAGRERYRAPTPVYVGDEHTARAVHRALLVASARGALRGSATVRLEHRREGYHPLLRFRTPRE